MIQKRLLKKRIILALCLGLTWTASGYAAQTNIGNAADIKTGTIDTAYGYKVDGTYSTITAASMLGEVNNGNWSPNGDAYAHAYGFGNIGYNGITVKNQTDSYLPITAIAIGGSSSASARATGIYGDNSSTTTINGNAIITATATGGSSPADAHALAFGIAGENSSITTVNGNAAIIATAIGGSSSAHAYGIWGNSNSSTTVNGNATITATASSGSSPAEADGINGVNSSTTINGNTAITATVTGSSASSIAYSVPAEATGINGNNSSTTINGNATITAIATGSNAPSNASAAASADGIWGYSNSSTTINGNATIIAMATGGSASSNVSAAVAGINGNNSTTTINGNTTITATATGGSASSTTYAQAFGIFGNNLLTTINGNATITAIATGGSGFTYGASLGAIAAGIEGVSSSTTINGNATIAAIATATNGDASAQGIGGSGQSTTTINGDATITATATGTASSNADVEGIYAFGASAVTLKGNAIITAIAKAGTANAYALSADGSESNISINQSGSHLVRIIGDVAASNNSAINLTLNNNSSNLRGNVLTDSSGKVNLTLASGAEWQPVYDNSNGTQNSYNSIYTNHSSYTLSSDYIGALTLDGGIIDLTWDNYARTTYRTLTIGSISGGGTVKINTDLRNNTGDKLNLTGGSSLGVAITYDPVMDSLTGLGYHYIGSSYSTLGAGSLTLSGVTSEYKAYAYIPVFNGLTVSGLNLGVSSNTKAVASAASGAGMLLQVGGNHLRKRLGDLRESPVAEAGAWARVYAGDISNNKYDQTEMDYSGLQAGYDKSMAVKNGRKYLGGALSYTQGNNSFTRGGGDSKAYDLALYQTWLGSDGHYYDLIAKHGRINNAYHVTDLSDNYANADYHTSTNSLSAEYGYQKRLSNGWYLEPQAELTFGRIDGVSYITSSGMKVEQDSIDRLIGRLGLGIGRKLNSGNHLYTSLSVLQEFKGRENIKADTVDYSQDMSGRWYEFILGLNTKMGQHSSGYLNVEKLFGGDMHSNWQLNAGCRWSF